MGQRTSRRDCVVAKLRAALDDQENLAAVYGWLEKWKPALERCRRSGGVWDERFEVTVPRSAIKELPMSIVYSVHEDFMPDSRKKH